MVAAQRNLFQSGGHQGFACSGGRSRAPRSRRAGSVNEPVRPATPKPALLVGQAQQERLGGVQWTDNAATTASAVQRVPTFSPRSAARAVAVLAVFDDHALIACGGVVAYPGAGAGRVASGRHQQ
jgi:hypothetical protein